MIHVFPIWATSGLNPATAEALEGFIGIFLSHKSKSVGVFGGYDFWGPMYVKAGLRLGTHTYSESLGGEESVDSQESQFNIKESAYYWGGMIGSRWNLTNRFFIGIDWIAFFPVLTRQGSVTVEGRGSVSQEAVASKKKELQGSSPSNDGSLLRPYLGINF